MQWDRGVVGFLRFHRGHQFPSSAMMAPITRAFVDSIEQLVTSHDIPLIWFTKKQRRQCLSDLITEIVFGAESTEKCSEVTRGACARMMWLGST